MAGVGTNGNLWDNFLLYVSINLLYLSPLCFFFFIHEHIFRVEGGVLDVSSLILWARGV